MSFFFTALWAMPVVFIVASCVVPIWKAVTRPKRWRGEPACERCGYTVTGLASLACPECGADMRRTGIITPAMELRRRGSMRSAMFAWTVLGLFGTYLAILVLSIFFGFAGWFNSPTPSTTVTQTLVPKSGDYEMVKLELSQYRRTDVTDSAMTITFTANDGKIATIQGTSSGSGWFFPSPADSDSPTITQIGMPRPADLKAVMQNAGIDVGRADAGQECEELASLIRERGDQSAEKATGTETALSAFDVGVPSITSKLTAGGVQGLDTADVVLIVGLVLWLLGTVFIVMRRRRLIRMAAIYESAAMPSGPQPVQLSSSPQ